MANLFNVLDHEVSDDVIGKIGAYLNEPPARTKDGLANAIPAILCALHQKTATTAGQSDVFSPIVGEVTEVNGDLTGQPALVNEDAEGKAWFFKIKVADAAELDALMDRAAYEAFVKESS